MKLLLRCAPIVADLMATELGWNEEEKLRQIESFVAEFEKEYQANEEKRRQTFNDCHR